MYFVTCRRSQYNNQEELDIWKFISGIFHDSQWIHKAASFGVGNIWSLYWRDVIFIQRVYYEWYYLYCAEVDYILSCYSKCWLESSKVYSGWILRSNFSPRKYEEICRVTRREHLCRNLSWCYWSREKYWQWGLIIK